MSRIALLATGDEVIEGEVLNSNGQEVAQFLTDAGYQVGLHLACRDDKQAILAAIGFLLEQHQGVIIIGGLGPTVDDLTRYAVADYLKRPLVFYPETWHWIEQRYQRLKLEIPQTNKKQAMFPQGADILANAYGSADGCSIIDNQKLIIMLPGPPNECLPIMREQLLPQLEKCMTKTLAKLYRWRVFGVSESHLAQEIETQFPEISKSVAYRWHYPYIDVKYRHSEQNQIQALAEYLSQFQVCPNNSTASTELKQFVLQSQYKLNIKDNVTGGLLQTLLLTPETYSNFDFSNNGLNDYDYVVELNGLEAYWQQKSQQAQATFSIKITTKDNTWLQSFNLPNRSAGLPIYAAEYIALKLHHYLEEQG